jgi:hypothetical protein
VRALKKSLIFEFSWQPFLLFERAKMAAASTELSTIKMLFIVGKMKFYIQNNTGTKNPGTKNPVTKNP